MANNLLVVCPVCGRVWVEDPDNVEKKAFCPNSCKVSHYSRGLGIQELKDLLCTIKEVQG